MIRRAFGNTLYEVRELLEISQPDLGQRGRLDQAYISRLEHGAVDPKFSMIFRLANALDVDIDTFWTEVRHHMANLSLIEPREIKYSMQILPGDILSVTAASRIDAENNAPFIEQIFGMAKQANLPRILMDLSLCMCHFSEKEQREGAQHELKWMKKNSFWPIVAVVANATLSRLGASIARDDGHRVQIFDQKQSAQQWLLEQKVKES